MHKSKSLCLAKDNNIFKFSSINTFGILVSLKESVYKANSILFPLKWVFEEVMSEE